MTDDLTFDPETVTIAQGGTVTWENIGSIDHTVTAYGDESPDSSVYFASGGFDSEQTARQNMGAGLIPSGEMFSHTFVRPGRYGYFCVPHESAGMTGTVALSSLPRNIEFTRRSHPVTTRTHLKPPTESKGRFRSHEHPLPRVERSQEYCTTLPRNAESVRSGLLSVSSTYRRDSTCRDQ